MILGPTGQNFRLLMHLFASLTSAGLHRRAKLAMKSANARMIVSAVLAWARPHMNTLATLSIETSNAKKQHSCNALFLRSSLSPVFAIEEANSWKT